LLVRLDAIILAGGYGKRLWSTTLNVAKPLLPICGKPVIEHIMEKSERPVSTLISTGICIFPKEVLDMIKEYFCEGQKR